MRLLRGIGLTSLLLAMLAIAQPAFAQGNAGNDDQGIGVGALAMATFPSVSNLEGGLDAKSGYGFGLWVGGNKNGTVGFTGEFIYLVKKYEGEFGKATQKALHIPAVFHINIGSRTTNGARGYAIIGPSFTINVNDELTGGLAGDNFAGADIGIVGGAGFEVARLGIEGRGNWGLKNISDDGVTSDSKEFRFELVGKFRFN